MPFLYHARPPGMRGELLYPLNLLRSVHPDLYEHERRKYVGREALLDLRIPVLGVRWNDALHLSPLHPYRLAAAWRAAGLSSPAWEREFFEIPVERLRGHPCVWFASGALSDDGSRREGAVLSLPVEEMTPFDLDAYRGLAQPPAGYREYLRDCRERGRHARPFAHVPHVLVAAPFDVAGLRLVRADAAPD
jgi:hypothetical protein